MQLASRSTRSLAQMLDGFITFLPFISVAMLSLVSETLGGISILSVLPFALAYYFFADALPGGQSLGKRMLGVAVVDKHTHAPCSLAQSFVRNLLLAVLGMLDWLFIFGDGRQRLGDMLAGTIVVDAVAIQQAGYARGGIAAG